MLWKRNAASLSYGIHVISIATFQWLVYLPQLICPNLCYPTVYQNVSDLLTIKFFVAMLPTLRTG